MVSPAFGTCDTKALRCLALQEPGGAACAFLGWPHPAPSLQRPLRPGCPFCNCYSTQQSFRARVAQTYAIKNTQKKKSRDSWRKTPQTGVAEPTSDGHTVRSSRPNRGLMFPGHHQSRWGRRVMCSGVLFWKLSAVLLRCRYVNLFF